MLRRSAIAATLVLLLVIAAAVLAWWLPRRAYEVGVAETSWLGTIVHVSDGDTIDVDGPRGRERVRLLGIDAPELAKDGQAAGCGADAAKASLQARTGHRVRVVPDTVGDVRDRWGRVLAYVEDSGQDLALAQVQGGWAEAWHPASSAVPTRDKAYRAAQRRAQAERAGAWANCPRLGR